MNTNYIEELNESQCAAVTYNDGPSPVSYTHLDVYKRQPIY